MNYFVREGQPVVEPSKITTIIRKGKVFRHDVAGAGGWGDPLKRDPDAVLKDVRNGLVSIPSARMSYDVVVTEQPWMGPPRKVCVHEWRPNEGWNLLPPFSGPIPRRHLEVS
jgi:N-methylhydantoinase B